MKTLIIILISVFTIFNSSAQSLAEVTGETKSLYNAICIYNDFTPGDITMTEFRVLAQEYAASKGLNYELYEFNGGNNLFILYYEGSLEEEEYMKSSDERFHTTPSTGCICDVPTYTRDTFIDVDTTIYFNINNVPVLIPTSISLNLDSEIIVESSTKTTQDFTCSCEGKTVRELNKYYSDLLKIRVSDGTLLRNEIDACALHVRQIKKHVEHEERIERIALRKSKRKKNKSKVVRYLGKGHAKGKGNGFITKLFPYIHCRG